MLLLRQITRALDTKSDHTVPEEFFLDMLDEQFSADETLRQLETAISWGRYAELFDFDASRRRFILPEKEETRGSGGRGAGRMSAADQALPRIPPLSRSLVLERTWPFFLDLSVAACGLGLFYAVLRIAQYWMGHPVAAVAISHFAQRCCRCTPSTPWCASASPTC